MSQEDLELVREHVEAFNAGDSERALSLLEFDVVFDVTRYAAEGEVVFGRSGIDRFAARFKGSFAEYDYEMTEYRDLGKGVILAVGAERGRGKASGAVTDRPLAGLYRVADGRIVHITMFQSESEALKAVGLSE